MNLSFAANIRFVSVNEFHDLRRKFQAQEVLDDEYKPCKSGYTEGLCSCTGGGYNNKQDGVVFHYTDYPSEDDENSMKTKADELRKGEDKLQGLLIGGNRYIPASFFRFERLHNLLKEKVDFSILWGQNSMFDSTRVLYAPLPEDTWYIVHQNKDNEENIDHKIDTLAALRQVYAHIKIAEGDHLFIGNEEVNL